MTLYAHRWSTAAFRIPWRTSATRSAVACWLAILLALAACDQAAPAAPPPGSAAGALPPAAAPSPEPASSPSPTAGPAPTPAPTPSPAAMAAPDGGWRGLTVSAEDRCSPYDPDDYPYSQSVEPRIIAGMGGIVYGPYTGRTFADRGETDIEHIVARSEAHDSGLCAADSATRRRFASDLLNLTLAAPSVNRHRKVAKDAAEWLPDMNRCWFADRVVRVRQKYDLTIDRREAEALDSVLSGCTSVEMVFADSPLPAPTPTMRSSSANALELWDDNGNGRITCAEARKHGIAPVRRNHPAYEYMRDADGDGVVCE